MWFVKVAKWIYFLNRLSITTVICPQPKFHDSINLSTFMIFHVKLLNIKLLNFPSRILEDVVEVYCFGEGEGKGMVANDIIKET